MVNDLKGCIIKKSFKKFRLLDLNKTIFYQFSYQTDSHEVGDGQDDPWRHELGEGSAVRAVHRFLEHHRQRSLQLKKYWIINIYLSFVRVKLNDN